MSAVRGLLTGVTDCGRADLLKAESPATALLSRGFPCRRAAATPRPNSVAQVSSAKPESIMTRHLSDRACCSAGRAAIGSP